MILNIFIGLMDIAFSLVRLFSSSLSNFLLIFIDSLYSEYINSLLMYIAEQLPRVAPFSIVS